MRYLFPTKTSIIEFAKRNPRDCYFLFSAQEKDGTIQTSQFHTRRGRPTAAFGHHCQSRFFRCPRRRPFRLVRWKTQKEKDKRFSQIFQSGAEFHV